MKFIKIFLPLFFAVLIFGCKSAKEGDELSDESLERAAQLARLGNKMTDEQIEESVNLIIATIDKTSGRLVNVLINETNESAIKKEVKSIKNKYYNVIKLATFLDQSPRLTPEQRLKINRALEDARQRFVKEGYHVTTKELKRYIFY